ncbi:hypothetical protein AB1Y20_003958 [Prymnesium parvum]|uniref:Uncharacterized protein n=1 Tax=Prymnesium parvum TaxID=97485 RepID=A0AB34J8J3_PRYPA
MRAPSVRALAPPLLLPALLMSAAPFTPAEIDRAIASLHAAGAPPSRCGAELQRLLASAAHSPHKDWPRTEAHAAELASLLGGPDDPAFRRAFHRVLHDGNWDAAAAAASARRERKPWVVLVTGVNGIRKTSSVYQPWFKEALAASLGGSYAGAVEDLPAGDDSFFRQLDYMIATLALEEFKALYRVEDVAAYAKQKDAIFSRYRTYAELLGVLLVKEAQKRGLNVMVETSGRDIAMFQYIDYFFSDDDYNKLVVHFTINDLKFAEQSVDTRMLREMADGRAALATNDPQAIIKANAGGPYGSAALRGVQAESDKVWAAVKQGGEVSESWLKATIAITAHETQPWKSTPSLTGGAGPECESYTFAPR